jgi:hypothetical protein
MNEAKGLEPFSIEALRRSGGTKEDMALSLTGFGPAPKYATESSLEGQIKAAYDKYVVPKETPYEQAERSQELRQARELYNRGDSRYITVMEGLQNKYHLNGEDMRRIQKTTNDTTPEVVRLFKRLDWETQKHILDANWKSMSPDERNLYLMNSNKSHLRNHYEPPGAE